MTPPAAGHAWSAASQKIPKSAGRPHAICSCELNWTRGRQVPGWRCRPKCYPCVKGASECPAGRSRPDAARSRLAVQHIDPARPESDRTAIHMTPEIELDAMLRRYGGPAVVSPDGEKIAFCGGARQLKALWVRSLSQPDGAALPGTEERLVPFWSPNSRYWASLPTEN